MQGRGWAPNHQAAARQHPSSYPIVHPPHYHVHQRHHGLQYEPAPPPPPPVQHYGHPAGVQPHGHPHRHMAAAVQQPGVSPAAAALLSGLATYRRHPAARSLSVPRRAESPPDYYGNFSEHVGPHTGCPVHSPFRYWLDEHGVPGPSYQAYPPPPAPLRGLPHPATHPLHMSQEFHPRPINRTLHRRNTQPVSRGPLIDQRSGRRGNRSAILRAIHHRGRTDEAALEGGCHRVAGRQGREPTLGSGARSSGGIASVNERAGIFARFPRASGPRSLKAVSGISRPWWSVFTAPGRV